MQKMQKKEILSFAAKFVFKMSSIIDMMIAGIVAGAVLEHDLPWETFEVLLVLITVSIGLWCGAYFLER